MSIVLKTPSNGSVTLAEQDTASNVTVTIPAVNSTLDTLARSGNVLQVVSTNYTSAFSSTSATPVDVADFSATITPSSLTSKILVFVTVYFGFANDTYPYVLLLRNGVSIGAGTTATGSQINTFLTGTGTNTGVTIYRMESTSKCILDSPNTTSPILYKIQFANPYQIVSNVAYINRQNSTDNGPYIQRPSSSITLMEIAG
jgi:hypothetical protein